MLLGKKLSGNTKDANTKGVQRNNPESTDPARALIGDPRNDENVIVSNLQNSCDFTITWSMSCRREMNACQRLKMRSVKSGGTINGLF